MQEQRQSKNPKLSRTMRIDIAPGDMDAAPASRKATRVITRKSRQIYPGAPESTDETAPAATGSDFRELFQSVYDAAVITDMNGQIVDANVRAVGFFGYSKDKLQKLSIVDLISGSDESLIPTICENLKERFILIEACYCARKNGTYFPAEIAVNQLLLSEQDYLCFFVRDITLRREAEKQLRIEHNAIQNSRSGIAITDLDAKIQYVNPAVCAMWGYVDSTELLGKDIRDLWRESGADDDLMEAIIGHEQTWMHEMVAQRSDGTEFDVQVTAACNRDSDDELVGMVFSFVDISDRKRAEEATREAERHRVMLESLGAACHHLGQPATVLLANLGIMNKNIPKDNGRLTELLASSMEAAEAVSEVLHKLNAVNEYRTTPYLEDKTGEGDESRILEI